jgi:glycosyltransferase involved in cell wall biosynthesis
MITQAEQRIAEEQRDQREKVARLEAELETYKVRAATLSDRCVTLRQSLDEATNDRATLQAENDALQTSLQDAISKYRESGERCDELERRWRAADSNVAALEAASTELKGRLAIIQEQCATLEAALLAGQEALHQLQEERDALNLALAEAHDACERLTEQAQREHEEVVRVQASLSERESELELLQTKLTTAEHDAQQERLLLHGEIARLTRELDSASESFSDEQSKHVAAQEDLKATLAEFRNLQQERHQTEGELSALNERLSRAENARSSLERISISLKDELDAERAAHAGTLQALSRASSEAQTLAALRRDQEHVAEQLRLQALRTANQLRESERAVEQVRQQKLAAEYQVTKTRATLSFQLGYLLIHGFKSVRAFRELPRALWDLHKEAGRRQAIKRQQLVSPASGPVSRERMPVTPRARPPELSTRATRISETRALKVASIMDEFTFSSFDPECNLLALTPEYWQTELEQFQPQLLLVESAWRGKDDLWGSKIGHASKELRDALDWCRKRSIPSVFWNKEDPVHFETFLTTAKLFDYVFTTDIDCIPRYKTALGHDHVYLLPFAAQPRLSNPIETYDRKDAFCFAGAYYVRYPERTRDLGNFVAELPEFRPLEIYDRNFGKSDPNYQFPPEYESCIVGNLPFEKIDRAYKGYCYAINLNSIKQSQTMFARRVFELLASNTITVSNFSRGVRLLFGDLVVATDSGKEIVRRLTALGSNQAQMRKFRLAALRKVMSEHTYQDRFTYIVSKVQGTGFAPPLPPVAICVYARTQEQFDALWHSYSRQTYVHKTLFVVVPGGMTLDNVPDDAQICICPAPDLAEQSVSTLLVGIEWIAGMVFDDYYGPNYLMDLILATRYSTATAIGKASYHHWSVTSGLKIASEGCQYRPVSAVPARAALVSLARLGELSLREYVISLYKRQIEAGEDAGSVLSIDEFNYCRNGGASFPDDQQAAVNDLPNLDPGLSMQELNSRAEKIPPEAEQIDRAPVWSGSKLAGLFNTGGNPSVRLEVRGNQWHVESALLDGKHDYLYAPTDLRPSDLGADSAIRFYFDVTPGLNLQLVLLFLDAQKQRTGSSIKLANRNEDAELPAGTAWIRLGLRVYASGAADVRGLVLGHRPLQSTEVLERADSLVLTNQYPSYDDLYRNAFVHSRVLAYRERNVRPDVFRLQPVERLSYHEFQDVDVLTGSDEVLSNLLAQGRYRNILVHFLNEAMWRVLRRHSEQSRVLVWVHGAEIQPWHRRAFNYQSPYELDSAKAQSEARLKFWGELLKHPHDNLKLVFVSNYLATTVMEDLDLRLPVESYTIIPNPIDTNLFAYHQKSPEQRKKILSIRPYATRSYANDLSVGAIQALASKPYFRDLEFRLIGDGRLFDETLDPLRRFHNVYIERRFLTQVEIANLHKEYGIFLCPSRMDTQGVSRDEAMSSGLVPVTNNVAAIPEFVDASCGILAREDNAQDIADGIASLYENPDRFLSMSETAASRVRTDRSVAQVIEKELALLRR